MSKVIRRGLIALVVGALFIGGTPVSARQMDAAAPIPCKRHALKVLSGQRSMETVSLRDFWIEASVKKKTYKIGDTIQFPVNVSRPAEQDPFGGGVPTDAGSLGPVEEASVGAGVLIGDVFLPGFGITDANGDTVLKVKIENYVKPGVADVAFYSWKIVQDTPCLRIEENGFRAFSRMFTVKK
jgi:hypothetical protein